VQLCTSTSAGDLDRRLSHSRASTSESSSGIATLTHPVRPAQLKQENGHAGATCDKPSASARQITPAKLAALSSLLHIPVKELQERVLQAPGAAYLIKSQPEALQAALQRAKQELGMSDHDARCALAQEPELIVSSQPGALQAAAAKLASALGVAPSDVASAAAAVPSILRRDPATVSTRLKAVSQTMGAAPLKAVLRAAAAAPQLLTVSPRCLGVRLKLAAAVFRKPPRLVVRAVMLRSPHHPFGCADLLFMSPRILVNKLRVLQAIIDKETRHIAALALACPQLLRCDLDSLQETYRALPQLTGLSEGHAYAMVCHSPELLLEDAMTVTARMRTLWRAMSACTAWAQQWQKLSPAQAADCLNATRATYTRLEFLATSQQAGSIGLHQALCMAKSDFVARFPAYSEAAPVLLKQAEAQGNALRQAMAAKRAAQEQQRLEARAEAMQRRGAGMAAAAAMGAAAAGGVAARGRAQQRQGQVAGRARSSRSGAAANRQSVKQAPAPQQVQQQQQRGRQQRLQQRHSPLQSDSLHAAAPATGGQQAGHANGFEVAAAKAAASVVGGDSHAKLQHPELGQQLEVHSPGRPGAASGNGSIGPGHEHHANGTMAPPSHGNTHVPVLQHSQPPPQPVQVPLVLPAPAAAEAVAPGQRRRQRISRQRPAASDGDHHPQQPLPQHEQLLVSAVAAAGAASSGHHELWEGGSSNGVSSNGRLVIHSHVTANGSNGGSCNGHTGAVNGAGMSHAQRMAHASVASLSHGHAMGEGVNGVGHAQQATQPAGAGQAVLAAAGGEA